MNDKERKELEALMNKREKELESEIAELKELTKPISPENAIGRVSRMDAINNKSVNEAALRKAEENLKKLTYAQSRINEPDFGLCARCKNPIPVARIMLMPHSNKCVHCAD